MLKEKSSGKGKIQAVGKQGVGIAELVGFFVIWVMMSACIVHVLSVVEEKGIWAWARSPGPKGYSAHTGSDAGLYTSQWKDQLNVNTAVQVGSHKVVHQSPEGTDDLRMSHSDSGSLR